MEELTNIVWANLEAAEKAVRESVRADFLRDGMLTPAGWLFEKVPGGLKVFKADMAGTCCEAHAQLELSYILNHRKSYAIAITMMNCRPADNLEPEDLIRLFELRSAGIPQLIKDPMMRTTVTFVGGPVKTGSTQWLAIANAEGISEFTNQTESAPVVQSRAEKIVSKFGPRIGNWLGDTGVA